MSEIISMTKLEAVNEMLFDMGARPVSSIVGNSRLDVVRAEATLDRVTRETNSRGWWYNREERTFTPDASGQYLIPTNVVRLDEFEGLSRSATGDATTGSAPNFVIRTISGIRKLINVVDQVSTGYTSELTMNVSVLLEFEQLPAQVRAYIYAKASAINVLRAIGATDLVANLNAQADILLAEMKAEELTELNLTMATSPRNTRLIWNR